MEIVYSMLNSMLDIMNVQFSIWGHTLTLWKIFVFTFVSIVVSYVVWEVIDGG